MKFTIGTNFDDSLIKALGKFDKKNQIEEFFGAVSLGPTGGGISHGILKDKNTTKQFLFHIKLIQESGYQFNYVINNTCFSNKEYTKEYLNNLFEFLAFLHKNNVQNITLANPFLIEKIKVHFPHFKIKASITMGINTISQIDQLKDLELSGIVLDDQINRNLDLLKAIRKTYSKDITLIANQNCTYGCPNRINHKNFLSHYNSKQKNAIDYCYLNCSLRTVKSPENILQSRWIRPEDIDIYEKTGITQLKIGMRSYPTETIIKTAKAYLERTYKGNLLDLLYGNYAHSLQIPGSIINSKKYDDILAYNKQTNYDNNSTYYIKFNLPEYFIYLDNKKLNGIREIIKNNSCEKLSCKSCSACLNLAKDALSITDTKLQNRYISLLKEIKNNVI